MEEDNFKKIKKICEQKTGLDPQALSRELDTIKKLGFTNFFYNLYQQKKQGNKNNVNSIVAYALGITSKYPDGEFSPRKKITSARTSLPDIDLDFADTRRDEVIQYVSEKYGQDKVAQIITFGTMAARAVIRDVGRVLNYPYIFCDKIAKMIPFGFNLGDTQKQIPEFRELYESDERVRRLVDLAKKLEGVARHASTHACGVVISPEPLDKLVPLQHPTQNDGAIVTQYGMHSIEDLGLLKMDFLGLKNLTIIENTIKLVKKIRGEEINIDEIPEDDKKTYRLFQNAETTSVFQLESSGMKKWLKQLQPTKFDDIVAMVALYRPGPMQFIPEYIARKKKKRKIEYIHPKLEPILETTYGIPIFQEQMMQIAQEIAGFSLAEADILRKAIGKKISSLLHQQKEKFIKGAIKNKINKNIAEKIWSWFLPFAQYGFNKSHSSGYGKIAFQTAYLKAHYPVEFMAAVFTSERQDVERTAFLIEECKRMGIKVLPPDINESFPNFTVISKNEIRFGLWAIKNVGHNIVETIIGARKIGGKFNSVADFVNRIHSRDLNKKSMEALIKAGAFDKLEERGMLLENLERLLACSREVQGQKKNGQKGLFDSANSCPKITMSPAEPMKLREKLKWEKELLGLYISGHPLESFKKAFSKKTVSIEKIINDLSNQESKNVRIGPFFKKIIPGNRLTIGGIIVGIKKIITKTNRPMVFVQLEDLTGRIEVVVFPSLIENRNGNGIEENKIVLITGKTDFKDNSPKLIAETIETVVEE